MTLAYSHYDETNPDWLSTLHLGHERDSQAVERLKDGQEKKIVKKLQKHRRL